MLLVASRMTHFLFLQAPPSTDSPRLEAQSALYVDRQARGTNDGGRLENEDNVFEHMVHVLCQHAFAMNFLTLF